MSKIQRHKVVIVPEMDSGDEDYVVVDELNVVFISPRLLRELIEPDKDTVSLDLIA